MSDIITPNAAKNMRKYIKEQFADLRTRANEIRKLRKSDRFLDREDAEGLAVMWGHDARNLRARMAWFRSTTIVKGSAMSPNAWARHVRQHGG